MSGVNDVVPRFNYARFPHDRINSVLSEQDVDARVMVVGNAALGDAPPYRSPPGGACPKSRVSPARCQPKSHYSPVRILCTAMGAASSDLPYPCPVHSCGDRQDSGCVGHYGGA
jgi:hypothetical protein